MTVTARNRLLTLALILTVTVGLFFLVQETHLQGSSELHTIMETGATLIALFAGIIALVHYYTGGHGKFLLIGAGFLGTAALDAYHAVATSVWYDVLWASAPATLVPWSWYAPRFLLAVCMLGAWFLRRVERGPTEQRPRLIPQQAVYAAAVLLTGGAFVLFDVVQLPPAYALPGAIGRPQELLVAAILLAALVGFLRKGRWRIDPFEYWLIISLLLGVLAQVPFMALSRSLNDGMFTAAHLLKLISYCAVLVGLVTSVQRTFHHATENARRLLNLNQELESFAYSVSHDLRAPLRSMDGFSRILLDEYADYLPEKGRHYLHRVEHNARKMDELIEQLLAFSRLGRKKLKTEEVDVAGLVQEVWNDLSSERQGRQIELTRTDLPTVTGDANLLRSVFMNLLGNAIKYTRDEQPARIEVGAANENGIPFMYVSDNGVGFDMQYAHKMFNVFERLHGEHEYSGTGVGLATVQRIIHRHGGEIWARGAEGEGATFSFTIGHGRPEEEFHE